jgi:hypothetical protein
MKFTILLVKVLSIESSRADGGEGNRMGPTHSGVSLPVSDNRRTGVKAYPQKVGDETIGTIYHLRFLVWGFYPAEEIAP